MLDALDLADEERVVAGLVLAAEPALEPAERAVEERAARALADGDPVPHRDRRHAAREVLREPHLVAGEQRDREAARLAQQLVQRRLARDRDPDERRLERERDERADRQAEPLALDVDRDDGDPDGEAAHHRSRARRRSATARDHTVRALDGLAERVAGEELLLRLVHLQVEGLVVGAERVGLPVDVRA